MKDAGPLPRQLEKRRDVPTVGLSRPSTGVAGVLPLPLTRSGAAPPIRSMSRNGGSAMDRIMVMTIFDVYYYNAI